MLSAFSVYGDKHMKKIIDVSEHQKRIDWSKVSGVDGVIIRIGYGDDEIGQDDDYVKYNLDEVERLGIPYEVYFYSYANCEQQKVSEIAHIKRLIAGRNIKRIWLDLEYRPAQNYWRRMTEAFLRIRGQYRQARLQQKTSPLLPWLAIYEPCEDVRHQRLC